MTGASNGGDRRVRLTPPPRVTRPAHRRPTREGGVPLWLTVLVLATLGTAAFAVLVKLPQWVEAKPRIVREAPPDVLEAPDAATLPAEAADPTLLADANRVENPPSIPSNPDPEAVASVGADPRVGPNPVGPNPVDSNPTGPNPDPQPDPTDPTDPAFRQAMTEGLAALDRQDWPAAREAFERARSLRPDAPEAADGLVRVRGAETLARLTALRETARDHEKAERWQEAADAYRQALELDAAVAFAREGHARARARAELAQALDRHLAHPERLSSAEVREEATALIDRAREIESPGTRHRGQIDELSRLIREWSQPVTAELVSDAQTKVTVYRVGRLGAFQRRALELHPGTYTVVGHRDGYRDVRREWVIRPGETPEPLRVVCEEEI